MCWTAVLANAGGMSWWFLIVVLLGWLGVALVVGSIVGHGIVFGAGTPTLQPRRRLRLTKNSALTS